MPPSTSSETEIFSAIGRSQNQDARLRRVAAGSRGHFVQAVLAGFARHPREIGRHAEALARLARAVPATAEAVDRLLDLSDALEAACGDTISPEGIAPPPDNARFTFLLEGSDPGAAREDLAEAIALLVETPALDAAIAAATARFETDPEGAFAEQQRLRKRKLEIEQRLGQMARKRAAGPALEEKQSAAVAVSGQQETD